MAARLAASSLLVGLLLGPHPLGGRTSLPASRALLIPREDFLTEDDVRSIDRGRAVARVVETLDHTEVMAIGVLRVRASAARALERLRDVEARRGDGEVVAIRRIGTPPTPSDFADLTLPAADLNCLPKCRVGDCDVRLSAEWMRRFKREVDWSSPERQGAATNLFREMVFGYTRSYLAHGNAALPVYEDNRETMPAAENLEELLRRLDGPLEAIPELRRYLAQFPEGRPEGAEDSLYWVKERLWAHVVLSVNHVTILERTLGPRRMILAASKQIYTSHYFDSALRITVFVEEAAGDPWLVFMSRSRTDVRPGFTWLQRLLIRRLVSGRIEQRLVALRQRLEGAPPPLPAEP